MILSSRNEPTIADLKRQVRALKSRIIDIAFVQEQVIEGMENARTVLEQYEPTHALDTILIGGLTQMIELLEAV